MADIETNKSITLENLLSLRKKMLSTEINEEMIKISKLFAANGIKKAGPIVTTTFAVLLEIKVESLGFVTGNFLT